MSPSTMNVVGLQRAALVERVIGAGPVVLLEAGGGYGKTVLAHQVMAATAGPGLRVRLSRRDPVDIDGLAEHLAVAGERDWGLDPATAQAIARCPATLARTVAATLGTATVVIDNAQSLGPDAASWVAELAEHAAADLRLLCAARLMPAPLWGVELEGRATRLGTDTLRLTPTEAEALVIGELGARDGARLWSVLHEVTAGWVTLLVVALRRLGHATDREAAAVDLLEHSTLLADLLGYYMTELDAADRAALTQLAHVPLLSEGVADALGTPGVFQRLTRAGIPFAQRPDGWWHLPAPVAEHLSGLAPLDAEAAKCVAPLLVAGGAVLAAARLLVDAGERDAAAELLGGLPAVRIEGLDRRTLIRLVGLLREAADRHPRVLLHLARAHGSIGQLAEERAGLDRAVVATRDGVVADIGLVHEVEAEHAFVRAFERDGAAELPRVEALLATVTAGTRAEARLLEALGVVRSKRTDVDSLRAAESALLRAALAWEQVGEPTRASAARRGLAVRVLAELGSFDEAERLLLAAAGTGSRAYDRAFCLVFAARIAALAGRPEAAEDHLAEATRLGELLGIGWVAGHAAWTRALLGAAAGAAATVGHQLLVAERHLGQLVDGAGGVRFLAEAADASAQVGAAAGAARLLAAAGRRGGEDPVSVAAAEATVAARLGRPGAADGLAALLAGDEVPPAQRWQLWLLKGLAHMADGDRDAALAARHEALDHAARIGHPDLPAAREAAALAALVTLDDPQPADGATGRGGRSPVATSAGVGEVAATGSLITVLGAFAVSGNGTSTGRSAELVKRLVLARGSSGAETLIEDMWPDEAPGTGRRRLKNVLSRARVAFGPIVERRGAQLCLVGVDVDLHRFEALVERVVAAPAGDRASLAAVALQAYGGTLLPDDLFDDRFADRREAVRRRALWLVDVVLDAAVADHRADDALALLDIAADLDPFELGRHLRVAQELAALDRGPAARGLLAHVRSASEQLGAALPLAYRELQDRLGG